MIPANFEYHAPETIESALDLIGRFADDCKILSGGQSLIPLLKLRLAAPAAIVDIGRIKELDYIRVDGSTLRIGALSTHATIGASPEVKKLCPLLTETAAFIGDPQVRNRGTIRGSITHNDPAADWPAAILALNANVSLRSVRGERTVKAQDFFVGMLTSAARTDEIVTEVSIDLPAQAGASAYLKLAQPDSGFAIVGIAVQLDHSGGTFNGAGIGITGLAPVAYRAGSAETGLKGKKVEASVIEDAAKLADKDATDAMSDIHASGDYRRHLARVLTARGVKKAAGLS